MRSQSPTMQYLGFHDTWLRVIAIPIVGFLMPVLFFGKNLEGGISEYWVHWVEGTLHSVMYWEGARLIVINLRKRYPHFSDARKRILIQLVAVFIYSTIVSLFSRFVVHPLFERWSDPYDHSILGAVGTYSIIIIALSIYESIYFYYQLKLSIQEREQAKREHLRSELQGLRNQVNPHFLFNSLNTLMNIVAEDQQLAISFLKKLSKVYRYVLESRREQAIPLTEELEFIESYVFLQKERFHNSLVVDLDIPDHFRQHLMIPLALQILFENAIKHNIISRKHPLTIRVWVENGEKIVVHNNLQRKNTVMPSTQVGLENVRNRYRLFTDQQVEVQETKDHFQVSLPLLSPQHESP